MICARAQLVSAAGLFRQSAALWVGTCAEAFDAEMVNQWSPPPVCTACRDLQKPPPPQGKHAHTPLVIFWLSRAVTRPSGHGECLTRSMTPNHTRASDTLSASLCSPRFPSPMVVGTWMVNSMTVRCHQACMYMMALDAVGLPRTSVCAGLRAHAGWPAAAGD